MVVLNLENVPSSFKLAKCKKVSGILKVKLAKVFKHFKVKTTNGALKHICNKLELFLNGIIIKLIKSKGKELTLSTVKKLMNSKIVKK